jgi:predicted unusual protein kinase regulating ubiquinone biosynthesis (AarF/ABC1/UbiB family)
VPPFGAKAVRETIERNFGRRVEDIFTEFSFKPLAAASLGQVHFAKLDGKRVVVKVQRPGLKELFDVDLKNVRVIAQWLQVRPLLSSSIQQLVCCGASVPWKFHTLAPCMPLRVSVSSPS